MGMTEALLQTNLKRLQLPYFADHHTRLDGAGRARILVAWPAARASGRRVRSPVVMRP